LFIATAVVAVLDLLKDYWDRRHQTDLVLDKILNELSRALFPNAARHNRITLFNRTRGWRVFLWMLIRMPVRSKAYRWKAMWRIRWMGDYLGVYLRPMGTKGKKSSAAFRVSDVSEECEGVAGHIWDLAGQWMIYGLPKVDTKVAHNIASQQELDSNQTVKTYAADTNMLSYKVLYTCDEFARHFYGTLIRKSDGSPWGVLLLDSFQEECPFIANGNPIESFINRFNDFALILGKIVS
jgi:hypothetical protein